MQIRDVIHGSIHIEPHEVTIIDSKYFQRLRHIRQLGFAEYPFPNATHTRFVHSLGAMQTATQVFDQLFEAHRFRETNEFALPNEARQRYRAAVRLAALLHDIGHGPLSHTTEFAMPAVEKLDLPSSAAILTHPDGRKATHEDYSLKMILDSEMTVLLEKAALTCEVHPIHIACLLNAQLQCPDSFFKVGPTDFRPILTQIISSELDADRMDYLRRDSLHTGVSYGQFDFNWLLENLTSHFWNGKCYLSLQHRALYTFEDFLISRFHMFLMVYFHHKSVVYDEMLGRYFSSPDCDYFLPSNIEEYCKYHDAHLYAHLSASSNEWAQRIAYQQPYKVLIELHSGIPAVQEAQLEQEKLLNQLKSRLTEENIPFLTVTSVSEFSKYFKQPGHPIFVRYDNHYHTPRFIPLLQCTDLFQRYQENRSITRLYVADPEKALSKLNSPNSDAIG